MSNAVVNEKSVIHIDISPLHLIMQRCSLWCLLTALPGCSAGSSLTPCLTECLELMP